MLGIILHFNLELMFYKVVSSRSLPFLWLLLQLQLTSSKVNDHNNDNIKLYDTEVDEPDYSHLLYGNIWKHVVFEPSKNAEDQKQAIKVSLNLVSKSMIKFESHNFSARCLTKVDLWFSDSGYTPLVYTKLVANNKGYELPISVPVSFGTNYNLEIRITFNETEHLHFVTLTRSLEHEHFFVYSHSNYRASKHDVAMEMRNRYEHFFQFNRRAVNLTILSSLSNNKQLSPLHSNQDIASSVVTFDKCAGEKGVPKSETCSQFKQHFDNESQASNRTRWNTFTVMTYNIWNFNTYLGESVHYPTRMEAIGKLLKKNNPDIVAFQEVRFESPLGGSLGPSQMDYLISQMPGYQFVYQPAQLHKSSFDQGRTEEGVAIFSKFPIIHHDYLLLFRNRRNTADLHQRVCLHVVVDLPCIGKAHIFNTHLSLSHEAREESVKQIIQFMSVHGKDPVILVGDLNATPEEKAIRLLTEVAGFTDVWTLLQPSVEGYTFSAIEELIKRIDYIFLKKSDQVTAENIEVLQDNTRSSAASDHRAVQASFRIHCSDC